MTELVTFTDRSPRFALPFLLPGQGQKEFFFNEVVARADLLHHCAILGEAVTPPSASQKGDMWRVAAGAGGDWTGHDDTLAGWHGDDWLFIAPRDGMRVWDAGVAQFALYHGGWHYPATPAPVSGGGTVDAELRAAFTFLIEALETAGVFPDSP